MKIIGNGLLANAFKFSKFSFNENIIVFASGVSNSQNSDNTGYAREYDLLRTIDSGKKLIYFSTCSIYDKLNYDSSYVQHKLLMENYIKEEFRFYNILRLPQVVGRGGNPNNLLNYLYRSIRDNNIITVQKNAVRNIVDVEDIVRFSSICNKIDQGLINIAAPNSTGILSIINCFESIFDRIARVDLVDGGYGYSIDIADIRRIIVNFDSYFHGEYLRNVIEKYYAN